MTCFLSTLLAAPWYVWGVVCALVGLAVFVLFSAGYFFGVDRYCDRRRG